MAVAETPIPGGGGTPLLAVDGLTVTFKTRGGAFNAVDGVSFQLSAGEVLGLVGESGCGKSMTSLALMGLVPFPGKISAGSIRFRGRELTQLSSRAWRRLRGREMGMIFQEPMTSLNPVHTIGDQIVEVLCLHGAFKPVAAKAQAVALLQQVGIPSPERRVDDYPHQLSGGQRQRVMIAMALACDPMLLIADEPTTALDVTIQAQILELLRTCQAERHSAIILITHDLGVVAEVAHTVGVMYAGKIVELAPVAALYRDPQHPYTLGLLASVLTMEDGPGSAPKRLATIDGTVPNPQRLPAGCRFHPRCPFAVDRCRHEVPPLTTLAPGHQVACWRAPLPLDETALASRAAAEVAP
ncbi:MAG: ABC transporter ATP-binding protein [Candidatus Competibacterales bacterium]